jgi:hypothetical protein
MTGLLLTLALIIALAFSAWRWWRRRKLDRRLRALPGGSAATAIAVASFDEIDEEVRRRRCPCGGRHDVHGEGAETDNGRSLRIVQVECRFCERRSRIYFDVSRLFH